MDNSRAQTGFLFILTVLAVAAVLHVTGSVFIPLVIALLLSFVFSPIVRFLTKRGAPRSLSILIVLVIFLAFSFLVGLVLYSSVQSLLRQFPIYQRRISMLLTDLIVYFDLPSDILDEFQINRQIGSLLVSISGSFMSFLSGLILVIVFLFFVLLEQPFLHRKLTMAIQDRATKKITIMLAHINSQIGRYLGVKLFVSLLTATIVFVAFSIIGVDFPFIWSVLTFLFNFIPSIGSIMITALSAAFALVQFLPDWNLAIATFAAMGLTQMIVGNVIDPKLVGERLNLSPVVIVLSLLVWGWIWGIIGMFLAVPITGAMKITLENVPGVRPIGVLMGTGNFKKRKRRGDRSRTSERLRTGRQEGAVQDTHVVNDS
ncbi:MAG: AI-2E family transporter [Spirochaetota bacterium]